METEEQQFRSQLDSELDHLTFQGSKKVLQQTHPSSWREKLAALWNKELEIPLAPLLPVAAVASVLLLWGVIAHGPSGGHPDRTGSLTRLEHYELIEAGGNTYPKELYEKKMRGDAYEAQH